MSTLKNLSKDELLCHSKKLADQDHEISLKLIEALRECEARMLHLELGYSSLWDFAVRYLKLSESSAQIRISAMRLSSELPSVKEALENHTLSLSNAAQLQSFFRGEKKVGKVYSQEEKIQIIESVQGLSKKECEQRLFAISPQAIPQESLRVVSPEKSD